MALSLHFQQQKESSSSHRISNSNSNSHFLDTHSFFDPFQLTQHYQQQQSQPPYLQQQSSLANHFNSKSNLHSWFEQFSPPTSSSNSNSPSYNIEHKLDPMEFNGNQHSASNYNSSSNHFGQQQQQTGNSVITTHQSVNSNRNFLSGFNHHSQQQQQQQEHNIGADYEVICFVDSPPNSVESWTDDPAKQSPQSPPRAQILDVQTIYSHAGGARKRRMDWDSLDIGQSENSETEPSANVPPHKISQHSHNTSNDKDKHKHDKSNGRGNWSDEIGFDLNADFSNNSYLNNESFLTFTSGLNALKQEPHTEQQKVAKSVLNSIVDGSNKLAKSSTQPNKAHQSLQPKGILSESNNSIAECADAAAAAGSPSNFEANANAENVLSASNSAAANDSAEKARNGAAIQQLSVVDATKIENVPNNVASHSDEHKFQYILAAATSTATKNNEETLTYLNQGQSYEIKLKKTGDLSYYRDKILKSVIKICFHERRLQYMEREQMQQWQVARPGERIIEVDVPLSYGLCHVSQPLSPNHLNTVELYWDPLKEVGVYVKVNCISTEFTPKKHGGEKGVPFRLQIETYIESTNHSTANSAAAAAAVAGAAAASSASANAGANSIAGPHSPLSLASPGSPGATTPISNKQPVHAAACQIKVFKLKGADRKHKQDREKIQKRPQSEQEKFQPSYECTIMNDIPLDMISPSVGCFSPDYIKPWSNSPIHIPKYDGILPFASVSPVANSSPIVTSTNSPNLKLMDVNIVSPQPTAVSAEMDDYMMNIMPESSPAQVTQWLTSNRLSAYLTTFAHFSGADIMRMSKEDLIQICGLADGIRMFNILRSKPITPRLTFYVSLDGTSYNAVYLLCYNSKELTQKLFKLPGFYELLAKNANNPLENGSAGSSLYANSWNMHSKYSGSGSNIFNDVSKSFIYLNVRGVHVAVTDEVLSNEIKDGSLYGLEVLNGKVVMKLINKNEN